MCWAITRRLLGVATTTASNAWSSVVGGYSNTASGELATVAGGQFISAIGAGSFAAGSTANAVTDGCFVFGDYTTLNVVSCGSPNQFIARAMGGVFFFTGGQSDATYTGAELLPGASSWTMYSDRNGKANVMSIDPIAVLDRLAAMPMATWNWKSQGESVLHMGPMAQDFYAAYGLGETDRGISTVDGQGVALAAIQGLNAKLEAVITQQAHDLAEIKAQLAAMAAAR